jgi:hypothetical protein
MYRYVRLFSLINAAKGTMNIVKNARGIERIPAIIPNQVKT